VRECFHWALLQIFDLQGGQGATLNMMAGILSRISVYYKESPRNATTSLEVERL